MRGPKRLKHVAMLRRRLKFSSSHVIESLESRRLLSNVLTALPAGTTGALSAAGLEIAPAAAAGFYTPHYVLLDAHPQSGASNATGSLEPFSTAGPTGMTPAKMRHAYGVDQVMFGAVQGDGTGQTIAIVDAYDYPTIATDLHNFDTTFGLADPPSVTRINETGGSTLPGTDTAAKGNDWEVEEALDVEWAHAIAPAANLVLVEANGPTDTDLIVNAVNTARNLPGVVAVTMSFGRAEDSTILGLDQYMTTPTGHAGVTFMASTGDSGAPGEYPATSPNVLAVGGTTLTVDSSGNYTSEAGWSGSGGGLSNVEPQPSYQNGVVTQSTNQRAIPDVAFDADPATGASIYDTYDFGTSAPWMTVGGTSLSSPCWAGMIAIADQGRTIAGANSLDGLANTLPRVYAISGGNFHDITTGNNGNPAGTGYDLVTGRGSPVANTLVPALASSGPYVSGFSPAGLQSTAPSHVDFTFTTAMDPTSFSTASDVDAFTGPGNTDLRSSINGFSWPNNATLEVDFTAPTVQGPYKITIGPQILSTTGTAMDQNQDGIAGQTPADQFSGVFYYDLTPTQVASTNPPVGSTVSTPFTKLDLHLSAPFDPTTVSAQNLSINQGSVTAATVVNATTIEYTLGGIIGGTINVTMAQGALKDTNGNPVLAFSGSYVIPITTPPATGWTTYQGDTGHTGYVPGSQDQYYGQPLWSTVLPSGNLTDMSVGGDDVYVSSDASSQLFALNATTGAISWQDTLGSNASTNAPAFADGNVFVHTDNEATGTFLWSLNATTGAQNFKTTLNAQWEHYLAPTVAYGNVYMDGGTYGGMYSVSETSGALNWFGFVPQYDEWTPAVNSAFCYTFTGSGDTTPITGKFTILNRSTGATVSVTTDPGFVWTGYSMYEAVALGSNNDAFVTNGNRLLCFSTQAAGGLNWVVTDKYSGQVTVANGVLYVKDGSGIAALSEANGAKLWTWTPASGSISGRIIATDNMLFASSSTTTYAINLQTQQTAFTVAHGGNLALDHNTLYIAGSDGTMTAIGLLPLSAPPFVSAFTPTGLLSAAPSHVDFAFSTAMDPTSFSVASDVDAFTGPGNADLRSSINGFSWLNNNTTLEVDFTAPTVQGPYKITIGPQILSTVGNPMDQNRNGTPGEVPGDEFTGTFNYDITPTAVASTNPLVGSFVSSPFTRIDLHFTSPLDPATVSPSNLTINQGSVTAATIIDASTVEYTMSGVVTGGTVTLTLPQGALLDTNENPVLGFIGNYVIPIPSPPSVGWGTYQGNIGHTGYVSGSLDSSYHQTLWSTALPSGSLTDMAVGGGDVYVSSDASSQLFALNTTTGAISWKDTLGSNASTNAPAFADGNLFVHTDNEVSGTFLWSFNATTGAQLFKTTLDAQWEHYLAPTVAYGNVYMDGGHYGGMYSVSETTGALNWFGSVPQYDQWTPAVNSNYCYTFTGSGDTTPITGKFTILNRLTGATVSVTTDQGFAWGGYSMNEAVALGLNNDAFVTNGNRLLCFSTQSTGGINWIVSEQYSGQVTVANGVLYVQDGNGIAALSEQNGAKLWTWTPASGSISGRIIATDNMLFASNGATTYAISPWTRQTLWTVPYGGNLALDHQTLYISNSNGTVTAIGMQYASATSLAMTSGPNPSRTDQPLTFQATVTGGVPDGESVTLVDASNSNAVVAIGTLAGGAAMLTIAPDTLSAGTHSLVAVYAGDSTFATSQSAALTQTVQAIPLLDSIIGTSGIDLITLIESPDGRHIDWTLNGNIAQVVISDSNGLTINGNGANDVINLDYSNGNPLPNILHLDGSFTINGLQNLNGTMLEIGRSTVFIGYSVSDPLALIQGYLKNGYNNGAWNGIPTASTGVITSIPASSNAMQTTGIGYADSSDGLIAGQPANTIELIYTLYGDTTLSGAVGFNDFTRMTQHWNETTGGTWDTGDFNYDGSINSADYTLLTRAYSTTPGSQATTTITTPTLAATAASGSSTGTPVPAINVNSTPSAHPVSHHVPAKNHKKRRR